MRLAGVVLFCIKSATSYVDLTVPRYYTSTNMAVPAEEIVIPPHHHYIDFTFENFLLNPIAITDASSTKNGFYYSGRVPSGSSKCRVFGD